jgi:hypothetical protein
MYYKQRTWTAELDLELENFYGAEAEMSTFWENRNIDASV